MGGKGKEEKGRGGKEGGKEEGGKEGKREGRGGREESRKEGRKEGERNEYFPSSANHHLLQNLIFQLPWSTASTFFPVLK